jgi:hypothetical protein
MARRRWKDSFKSAKKEDGAADVESFALPLTGGESYQLVITPSLPPPNSSESTLVPLLECLHMQNAVQYPHAYDWD